MKFKFDINKTDKDFIDFNVFFNTKAPIGKKLNGILRICIVVIMLFFFFVNLIDDGFSLKNLIVSTIMYLIPLIVIEIIIQPIFVLLLKLFCKSMIKGKGKKPYTVSEVLEFYDDYIIETQEYVKSEIQYPIFESVYVVEGKAVYLNVSKNQIEIIPEHSFASPEQKKEFIEFIKTKCSNVVYYK